MRDLRIGEPGRHLARDDRSFHGLRPWTRRVVGEERHRRDVAWAMTGLAVSLENGKNVLIECHGCGCVRTSCENCSHQCSAPKPMSHVGLLGFLRQL